MSDNNAAGLWRAVLLQAITDATEPLSTKRLSTRMDQIRCREWFTRPNRDFDEVCHLAGVEPDRVRKHVVPLIAEASKRDQPMPDRATQKPYRRFSGRDRGVGQLPRENVRDRMSPSAQDSSNLEIF
ncbi:hypothetical protein [Bradyrhizobium sp. Leo170]|uniref:hypothetical protein n=1 Tax=Bradyrhizobium sp. Leo170 TaxID=1571199 RepID=UPI00102E7E10|nr:hypothetical protein [Bradyrhizobium sp. Leo170]TAI63453.1 hypothetical protein CWO89_24090 [Bradyrhizobium sp. Leo170]